MKLWSKKATWTMVILLAVMIIGFSGLEKFMEGLNDNSAWTEDLKVELTQVEEELDTTDLAEDKKVELLQRQEELQENISYNVENNKPSTREKVILETSGAMSLVMLLMIIVSAGIVATEFSTGTIKMLLSRPVKRWKILTSKYLTVLLFGLLLTVVTFVFSFISAYIFFPAAEGSFVLFNNSEIAIGAVFGESMYLVMLSFVYVCVMATLAFMIGSVFRSSSLAIGVSIFLYFTSTMIVMFLQEFAFAKYLVFAHNLDQYGMGFKMLESNTMPFSIAVLTAYVIVFLGISYVTFMKRDITA